jgi:hypothetical protein
MLAALATMAGVSVIVARLPADWLGQWWRLAPGLVRWWALESPCSIFVALAAGAHYDVIVKLSRRGDWRLWNRKQSGGGTCAA